MSEKPIAAGMSIDAAIRAGAGKLKAASVDGAERDARILVAAAAGLTGLDLLREPSRKLDAADSDRLAHMLDRRAARVPVSRILGQREFYGRPFKITSATLDPRSDTETLIEAVLELASRHGWHELPINILDIGTGSGCILLTLLAELPNARGLATDIDPEALMAARENARSLGIEDRASFACCTGLKGIDGTFDLLVSNPPYIPTAEIHDLEPDVKDHDPLAALDGGADGLAVYRDIIGDLTAVLPHGWAVFEVGAGQAESVGRLLAPVSVGDIQLWTDLGGHTRCVAAQTQS